MATMYTVLGGTLLNLGVTFSNQGSQVFANGSFIGAGELSCIRTFKSYRREFLVSNIEIPDHSSIFRGIKCFVIENAGVFLTLLLRSMQRVKKLDKFEKMVWFLKRLVKLPAAWCTPDTNHLSEVVNCPILNPSDHKLERSTITSNSKSYNSTIEVVIWHS